jgi:selenocysteine lyase/cysteine desulfurase
LQAKNAEAEVAKLAEHNVVASNRLNGVRISFHVCNTLEDMRAILGVLEKNLL